MVRSTSTDTLNNTVLLDLDNQEPCHAATWTRENPRRDARYIDLSLVPCTNSLYNALRRLEKLIADLLDVTRINSGQIDLNIAAFYFADALTNSIANVELTSHKHESSWKTR